MKEVAAPLCVCIGEVLWDILPQGRRLGGAPANVAAHLTQLGARGVIASAVGKDADGRQIVEQLDAMGVRTDGIVSVDALPTGTAGVTFDAHGIPVFSIGTSAAWDAIPLRHPLPDLAATADAIVFGTLAQRSPVSRETIRAFLKAAGPNCLRVLDVNLRAPHYDTGVVKASLELANILKLNESELPILAEMLGLQGGEDSVLHGLRECFNLDLLIYTKGSGGSKMITSGRDERHPGHPAQVIDTVGAGDAFTACTIMGRLRGMDLAETQDRANRVAAYVCGHPGAVPKLPLELVNEFR